MDNDNVIQLKTPVNETKDASTELFSTPANFRYGDTLAACKTCKMYVKLRCLDGYVVRARLFDLAAGRARHYHGPSL